MGGGRINGTVTGPRSLWCGISPGAGFFLPPGVGCICVFGSSFKNGDVSKYFILPEFCQRGKTPRVRSSDKPLRAAASRQNGTLRNITVFSHGYENISAAVPGEKQAGDKDGREMPAAEIFLRGVGYERGKREERREKG